MKKPKKTKPLYDENGRWVEERGRIKGAIRRAFRLSPQMKEAMQAARVELPPALKKDGTPGKKPRVRYKCAMCGELWSQKNVNVDHVSPVVPLHMQESSMSYDEIVRGIFCNNDNLQVLCSIAMKKNDGKPSCHKKKTDEERYIRSKIKKNDLKSHSLDVIERYIGILKKRYVLELKLKEEKANARRKRKNKK